MTLHILKLTTQNQSARTYDRSTFNPHFNLWAVAMPMEHLNCMGPSVSPCILYSEMVVTAYKHFCSPCTVWRSAGLQWCSKSPWWSACSAEGYQCPQFSDPAWQTAWGRWCCHTHCHCVPLPPNREQEDEAQWEITSWDYNRTSTTVDNYFSFIRPVPYNACSGTLRHVSINFT